MRCNKNYQNKFDENLKKGFINTYKLSKHNINKFILLLRDLFTHINFGDILLPEKKHFYSHLNMEGIIDADYAHGKKRL